MEAAAAVDVGRDSAAELLVFMELAADVLTVESVVHATSSAAAAMTAPEAEIRPVGVDHR
jgi:hypothetical protein